MNNIGYFKIPMTDNGGYPDIDVANDIPLQMHQDFENSIAIVKLEYKEKQENWHEITEAEFLLYFPLPNEETQTDEPKAPTPATLEDIKEIQLLNLQLLLEIAEREEMQ